MGGPPVGQDGAGSGGRSRPGVRRGRGRARDAPPAEADDRAGSEAREGAAERRTASAVRRQADDRRSRRVAGRRPACPEPLGAAAAARVDRRLRGPPRAARRPRRRPVAAAATPASRPCRTAPRAILAAALAALATGERLVLGRARRGDRRSRRRGARRRGSATPARSRVLEPRTALAYERSELVADETAARVAALAAWRSGRARVLVASVQALFQHTHRARRPARRSRSCCRSAPASPERARCASCSTSATSPVLEVAGRGEFARRGGIVDVFPPSAALPVRIEFFGDEIDSLRAFDPTDQRTIGRRRPRSTLLPATEFLLPPAASSAIAERLGRRAAPARAARGGPRSGSRARSRPTAGTRRDRGDARSAVGDAAEVWAPSSRPSTALDHLDPARSSCSTSRATSPRPADFLWRQADERRAELVESGDLPKDWPADVPRRRGDWKRRLLAAAHARADLGVRSAAEARLAGGGQARAMLFGWREPRPAAGRTARLAEAVERWAGEAAPRIVIASDQAPRLAELLGEAGRPSRSSTASASRRRPAPSRSSSAASTAASPAARTAWCSSPTGSSSAPSASAGPRRCAASCHGTSWSG